MIMSQHCQYYRREDGIHIVTIIESSRQAVDEWLDYLDLINTQRDVPPNIVLDITQSGLPPLTYFINTVQDWLRHHPDAPMAKTAVIYRQGNGLLSVMRSLARTLTFSNEQQVRFFAAHEYQEALDWLGDMVVEGGCV